MVNALGLIKSLQISLEGEDRKLYKTVGLGEVDFYQSSFMGVNYYQSRFKNEEEILHRLFR